MVCYDAKIMFLTRKSSKGYHVQYSIFTFVWAAVQSIPYFTLLLSENPEIFVYLPAQVTLYRVDYDLTIHS